MSKSGLIDIDRISMNRIIGQFLNIGGKVGVIIFILISGYFLIDREFKFKNLFRNILEVVFYSV